MAEPSSSSFLAEILKPGSSLNSTFFLVVDSVLAALLAVLLSLAYLTAGNLHVFILIGVELALWASIKWVIYELASLGSVNDGDRKKGL